MYGLPIYVTHVGGEFLPQDIEYLVVFKGAYIYSFSFTQRSAHPLPALDLYASIINADEAHTHLAVQFGICEGLRVP